MGAKVAFGREKRLADVATLINTLEARIRAAVPIARVIYIEPDVYSKPGTENPPTDTIVIKSAD